MEVVNGMHAFLDSITGWLDSGQYGFFTDFSAFMVKQAVIGYIAFIANAIPFAWGIAKELMNDLNISTYLNQAWGALDSDTRSIAAYLKIPEGINFILSSAVTKFVLRFIPGF
ncbi:uncharacterized protein DUF2523 [Marinobacterium halophilum]|uniref:Uncharacterized protein DUF2523 n=1 Tax=Marinobacterium halophilum TaxID=267374 RepID=A0A2P8ET48_9GAMM|nr:DUF2523 family protein [Marinobacterium halophilum]PSL12657.1 uncharacterized protein DUF2523 [Marinobacterium halophilum]